MTFRWGWQRDWATQTPDPSLAVEAAISITNRTKAAVENRMTKEETSTLIWSPRSVSAVSRGGPRPAGAKRRRSTHQAFNVMTRCERHVSLASLKGKGPICEEGERLAEQRRRMVVMDEVLLDSFLRMKTTLYCFRLSLWCTNRSQTLITPSTASHSSYASPPSNNKPAAACPLGP